MISASNHLRICAIVLAAGESRRMGAQKMLLPFGGKTVIAHIVDQLLQSEIGRNTLPPPRVYVVVGHEGDRIAKELSNRPILVVKNPDYKTGMLSSVRCGLRALPAECHAVLMALGDQPSITGELVDSMIHSYPKVNTGILIPCFQGRRGHPLLFSARHRDEIMTQYDDEGLRGFLRAHPDEIHELNVPAPEILSDMDYPEDYQRQRALFEQRSASTPKVP